MQSLDELLIASIDPEYLESMSYQRECLVNAALVDKNLSLLLEIAKADKINLDFLMQKKNELGCKLNDMIKIKKYLTA